MIRLVKGLYPESQYILVEDKANGSAVIQTLRAEFVGVLAMALTEVLNVMPILMRRTRLTKGLHWIIPAFALGKVAGSLIYYLIDGFYVL